MTILRQYSLPNCTLILEGLADLNNPASLLEIRPVMSILINMECHLASHPQPLIGGRELLENLVKAVSRYAQSCLSGVILPPESSPVMVQLQRYENLHRLSIHVSQKETVSADLQKNPISLSVDLTTVQLFDLVEAIDQFLADSQTLPDLSSSIEPISRHLIQAQEPLAKRSIPAALGISSLALAALALFFVPIPEVQSPQDPISQPNPNQNQSNPSPKATGSPPPSPPQSEPSITPISSINDPEEIANLQQRLSTQIQQTWIPKTPLTEDLSYRVTVAKDGAIMGYKSLASSNNDEVENLFSQLLYKSVGTRTNESLAQFQVTFSPKGTIQVTHIP